MGLKGPKNLNQETQSHRNHSVKTSHTQWGTSGGQLGNLDGVGDSQKCSYWVTTQDRVDDGPTTISQTPSFVVSPRLKQVLLSWNSSEFNNIVTAG